MQGEGGVLKLVAIGLGALAGWRRWARCCRGPPVRRGPAFDASARPVAAMLFSAAYLYVFEATSILILAALVGADRRWPRRT